MTNSNTDSTNNGNSDVSPDVAGKILNTRDLAAGFAAPLQHLGLISVTGDDAATFLHSQLTNDVEHLGQSELRLAGYCSPKGRLQVSFLMWRDAAAVYLQLSKDIQAPLQKRLSMFVLRAKAKLADAADGVAVIGFGGAAAQPALQARFGALPAAPWTRIDHASGALLRVSDLFGHPRYQWITTPQQADDALRALSATLLIGGDQAWQLAEIHAGVPQITAKTQEQFVPQMVNYELLGGVNFKKGCYPGQEIVARSQYLGKLKRRTALVSIADAQATAGMEVFDIRDPDQPCGMLVNAVPNGDGGADALVELKLASLDGDVRLGSAAGTRLQFLPMPYVLDALDL